MEIPWKRLESNTLMAMLEEIVSRDGTDYGEKEICMETRVRQLLRQIQKGEAFLYWDANTESASILAYEERYIRSDNPKDSSL
ncbi:MAG: YheU family protein [Gammaproteobacteria bacterium]|nr:YheU family protein [Gammaproteobacteria bacterium]